MKRSALMPWLDGLVQFALGYAAILGVFWCGMWFTVESMRWTSGPDVHTFPVGIYSGAGCSLFWVITSLLLSEAALRLPGDWMTRLRWPAAVSIAYLGTAYYMADWIGSHRNGIGIWGGLIFLLSVIAQLVRTQMRFVRAKSWYDIPLGLVIQYPIMFFAVALTFEDAYDQFVQGDDYAEALFQFGAPAVMATMCAAIPRFQWKSALAGVCALWLLFALTSNIPLVRGIEQGSWNVAEAAVRFGYALAMVAASTLPAALAGRLAHMAWNGIGGLRRYLRPEPRNTREAAPG